MARRPAVSVLLVVVLIASCATPPTKEIDQAREAIERARAARVDRYASDELKTAVDALQRCEQAVAQRDFRLALSLAIDSRDAALRATKAAEAARVRAREDAERTIADVEALLSELRTKLSNPKSPRLSRPAEQRHRATVNEATKSLQEARAALDAEEYTRTVEVSAATAMRLKAALKEIDAARTTPSPRKGR